MHDAAQRDASIDLATQVGPMYAYTVSRTSNQASNLRFYAGGPLRTHQEEANCSFSC